ncbi:MAG: HEPN domain-containing protein [Bryobacterales bacterium]|nr:HEPN domain-containing protein [Bryobacterales bacterium]MDE0296030.1 HEPN domain-containing protein [Bryobacterales bacterium]
MDEDALTAALKNVLIQVDDVSIATRDVSIRTQSGYLLTEGPLLAEMRESNIDHELAKIIFPILEVQPEFKDKALMINTGGGSMGFHSQFVATVLVREARRRKSAKDAVRWLKKVLETDSAEMLVIQTLWGISPKNRISVWKDVELLPFESLPPSRQKEQITNVLDWPYNLRLPTLFFAHEPPTAALISKTEVRPFLIDKSIEENSTDRDIRKAYPPLDDIRLCLGLEGPSIIIAGPSWFQYVDADLEAALIATSSSYGSQEILPFGLLIDSLETTTNLQAIVRGYMALEQRVKNQVHIALERLHQALIRTDPAARALEVSIALETLLIDDPGEHTFKISYRASLLISDTVEERMEARAIIQAAYSMRSALVHSGQTKSMVKIKGQGEKSAEEVASSAVTITALVIKRIIMRGSIPEWNRFELSDGRIWKS